MKKSMLFALESAKNFREDENLSLPSGNENAICYLLMSKKHLTQ